MIAVALALGAAVAWGAADFLGGLKSRAVATIVVVAFGQATGLVLVAAFVAARGEGSPATRFIVYAVLAGMAGAVGIAALYRGLAVGSMSIVAPITATGAVIPVAVGVGTGERPTALQGAGLALALGGVVLAARQPGGETLRGRVAAGVGLALLAALGIGSFLVALDAASEGGVAWALLVQRSVCLGLVLAAAVLLRTDISFSRVDLAPMVAIGALDMAANALFAVASTRGLVSVVSVVASLYPVTTVVLARLLLAERISRAQQVGVVAALTGVVLITAG
jgi:drug/metabolite transporter (DMT)-like permease